MSLLDFIGLALIIPLIDFLFIQDSLRSFLDNNSHLLFLFPSEYNPKLLLAIYFSLIYLVKNISLAILFFIQQLLCKKLQSLYEVKVFNHFLSIDFEEHDKLEPSEILRIISYDINYFADGIFLKGGQLFSEILLLVSLVIFLYFIEPYSFILIFSVIALLAFNFFLIRKFLSSLAITLQNVESDLLSKIQESFRSVKSIYSLGAKNFFLNYFSISSEDRASKRAIRDSVINMPKYITEGIVFAIIPLAFFYLGDTDDFLMNLSMIGFFAALLVRMVPLGNRIITSVSYLQTAIPSINKIIQLNDKIKLNLESSNLITASNFEKILIKDLNFFYERDHRILEDINLEIKKGEKIAISGESGSGKTTFLDLILGLYKPSSGSIEFFFNSLKISPTEIERNFFGYVPQDNYLYHANIDDNVSFGRKYVKGPKLKSILSDFKLENLYSHNKTKDMRDMTLSGGQRQRLGVARGLFNSPSLIVMDEATSSLDDETKRIILEKIFSNNPDATFIIVSHDKDILGMCDRQLVIRDACLTNIN